MNESSAEPNVEVLENPDMPETKTSFQNWALAIIGSLVVLGIASGIGMAIASSGHFSRLDTLIEQQAENRKEDKGKLDRVLEKIDALPKSVEITALNDRMKHVETTQEDRGREIMRQAQLITDNRHAVEARMESIESSIKIWTARQWGLFNMDRWISAAEKKLGKPLPSIADVTGKEPTQP